MILKPFNETIDLIDTLRENNDPRKVYRAAREAVTCAPLKGSFELHNKLTNQIRERTAILYSLYYASLIHELKFSKAVIDYIDHTPIGDEKKHLTPSNRT